MSTSNRNSNINDWAQLLDDPDRRLETLRLANGDLVLHDPDNDTAWLQSDFVVTVGQPADREAHR